MQRSQVAERQGLVPMQGHWAQLVMASYSTVVTGGQLEAARRVEKNRDP